MSRTTTTDAVRVLGESDLEMLLVARRLLKETPDVVAAATAKAVVVADTRDAFGGRLVVALLVAAGIPPLVAEEIATGHRSRSDAAGYGRLFAMWVPTAELARAFDQHGRGTLRLWLASLAQITGQVLVPILLRRDGETLLCAIEHTELDPGAEGAPRIGAAGTEPRPN